jgi:protein-arginine kinase activator protein McsA
MRAAMDTAIAQENFEDAARLRDEIRRLQETV